MTHELFAQMRFSKITEFNPVQHQPISKEWFAKP